ncbi:mucin TcMUCII, putative [Trypanosoma cruzi]|uniref:Mucin TcMUCII, putative n=1 Tax=Trypanosoma cruzi (strain CL Brener) TaxID=353153 RepID=Q4DXM7_TRYCC|nr:mucin TcMUCII, putative [Trypanosoma cruzi]EAN97282.1 mucin TcMUCII, putative [Trypanosoma cruzi]|eukprot:XP_819133.1 mucin TcMUCII [Trypanosoma cruzi strain CL Brener]
MCMRWSLVCRSCLLLPPPSVCWWCGRAVCACCRGLECVSCVVCGVRCMPGCCPLLVWCALCVCPPHLSSPLLLSMPLTVQISSTPLNDHTHDDDDVPSAVRPVGARPVLLPVRVCVRATGGLNKNTDLSSSQSHVQDQSDEEQDSETETVANPEGETSVDEGSGSEDPTLRKTQGSSVVLKTPDTTTTTTKAPTTTTTTTTVAPSTTTTEAPAVSTTRAPSRLREVDGSLGSSAWVCAPLLLAVCALAYTTMG